MTPRIVAALLSLPLTFGLVACDKKEEAKKEDAKKDDAKKDDAKADAAKADEAKPAEEAKPEAKEDAEPEAKPEAKEEGKEKVILFNWSGHGLLDLMAYDKYFSNELTNFVLDEAEIQASEKVFADFPKPELLRSR